jgi:hypothetical protein
VVLACAATDTIADACRFDFATFSGLAAHPYDVLRHKGGQYKCVSSLSLVRYRNNDYLVSPPVMATPSYEVLGVLCGLAVDCSSWRGDCTSAAMTP